MPDQIGLEIRIPFKFTRRPQAVAPDFRPDWKISMLLLILEICSRGGKSSLKKLHVLNWAVRTETHQREFEETRKSTSPLFSFNVRFEPAFSRAIDLAVAAALVAWVGGDRLELTASGRSAAKALIKDSGTFRPEVSFLNRVGKSVTEEEALRLMKGADIA